MNWSDWKRTVDKDLLDLFGPDLAAVLEELVVLARGGEVFGHAVDGGGGGAGRGGGERERKERGRRGKGGKGGVRGLRGEK